MAFRSTRVKRGCKGYVYFLFTDYGTIKIGSTEQVERRIEGMKLTLGAQPIFWLWFETDDYGSDEIELHEMLDRCRLWGEWFCIPNKTLESILMYCGFEENDIKTALFLNMNTIQVEYPEGYWAAEGLPRYAQSS